MIAMRGGVRGGDDTSALTCKSLRDEC